MINNLYDGIYLQIQEALEEGTSLASFRPQTEGGHREDLLPGALDAHFFYFEERPAVTNGDKDLLRHIFTLASKKLYDEAYKSALAFFEKRTVAPYYEAIVQVALEGVDKRDMNEVFFFFLEYMMLNSPHPECVKMGMTVCSLPTNLIQKVKDYFHTLGLYEEFTLYTALAYSRWGEEKSLLQLAQETRGWGRIQTLNYFKPTTFKNKRWFLENALDNDIDPMYGAMAIASTSILEERLKEGISLENLKAILKVLAALTKEKPLPYPLKSLPKGQELLTKALSLSEGVEESEVQDLHEELVSFKEE